MSTENIPTKIASNAELQPTRRRFFIVAVLFIGIMVAYLDRVNVTVLAANDNFLLDMGIKGQPVQIGMMMSAFLAAYGLANVTLSPLGDYLGPRKAMVFCIVLWTISLFIGGFAISFSMFIIARILLGIGEGFYYPMQSLFIKNWFPPQERGRANATWIIGQSLAPAIAMPVFTYIIGSYSWRDTFFICIALGLIPLYLLWFHTKDTPRESEKVNALELEYIEEGLAKENAPAGDKQSFLQRVKPFALNYRYWLLVFWYVCLQFMFWGLVSWLPTYLKSARNFSWTEMGWMASLPFILTVMTKAVNGWLNDRIGRSAPLLCVTMLLGASSIYLAATVPGKYLSAILLSCAFGFTSMATSSAWTLLQGLVPAKSLSTAAGTMNGLATGFSSLSPVVIGFFISLSGSYSTGLLCLVGVGFLAAVIAAVLVAHKY
ncbi:MFS transporter [Sporomusa sp.]|uniref:MFS transporter n=1 Tax=Sporomusa sp. TaxID=2078658 RepID=UPI002CF79B62|nr:MFS transporter [Sporomusa sp.]HWR05961.1 MFS transporter [Sporomusa sp.]